MNDIAHFLCAIFKESIDLGELSLKQGVITHTLVNNDTKVYSLIFADRLKENLNTITHERSNQAF